MKLKKGDRVNVYATLHGTMAESKGRVTHIDKKTGMLTLTLSKIYEWSITAHPKQCRKLRKKK